MGMKEVFLLPDDCSDSQKISCEPERKKRVSAEYAANLKS
jgi:hypothetical protein